MDAIRGMGNYALMEAARLQKERQGGEAAAAKEGARGINFAGEES